MKQIRFSEITVADIRTIAHVDEKDIEPYPWTQVDAIALSSEEQRQLNDITTRLRYYDVTLMNEATIWARAIYPLLMLAEQRPIQAWSQVPLRAQYPHIELQGIVDGVLGRGITNIAGTTYYLLIVEAKRGLESQDPRLALYGQLLAAARLNWESTRQDTQALYGCYTIVDTWKFFRAVVQDIDSENPTMLLEASREYGQKTEAEAILKLLKHIVASFGQNQEQP
jgi:hypothetical protein